MADEQPAENTPKRRVKNPETFRERALKAAEASDKPQRSSRFKQVGGKVVKPIASPVGRGARTVFQRQPFTLIGKLLRVIGRIVFPAYFRNSWRELRLVTWPNKKQSRQLTSAVLIFAIIFGGLIALVDLGLDKIFKQLLLK